MAEIESEIYLKPLPLCMWLTSEQIIQTSLKYIDVRLLDNFLIGATNPDHTFLGKDEMCSEESKCFHC